MIPTIPVVSTVPTVPTLTKFQIEQNQLPWLAVSYTEKNGRIVQGPAFNDDTYAPLTCKWYDDLVRIATIGDGSCFIHSVLKAFYREYQENNNAKFRLDLAARVRRDLAFVLGLENPQYPGHTYWETSAKGAFPRMVMQQINNEELIKDLRVDYSISGLKYLFNSHSQLGDEVYTFVADAMNIDIYVLRATRENLYPHYHTRNPNVIRNGIVIIGNMYHYEVLGVNTAEGFQTVFPPNDPFLEAMTKVFIGDGSFNDIINMIPYDPNETFADNFVEAFTTNTGLHIPNVINEIFPPDDPFRIELERLMPIIKEKAQQRIIIFASPEVKQFENPIITKLNQVLSVMEQAGVDQHQIQQIKQIVEHRLTLDPENESLNSIIASAETDGILSSDIVQNIIAAEITLQ